MLLANNARVLSSGGDVFNNSQRDSEALDAWIIGADEASFDLDVSDSRFGKYVEVYGGHRHLVFTGQAAEYLEKGDVVDAYDEDGKTHRHVITGIAIRTPATRSKPAELRVRFR